jgi:hypothetical protein
MNTLHDSTITKIDEGMRYLMSSFNIAISAEIYWIVHPEVCMTAYQSSPAIFTRELENEIRETLRARYSNS